MKTKKQKKMVDAPIELTISTEALAEIARQQKEAIEFFEKYFAPFIAAEDEK